MKEKSPKSMSVRVSIEGQKEKSPDIYRLGFFLFVVPLGIEPSTY
jgi:hypothetical protein